MPQLFIRAPPSPTFVAVRNKTTGALQSSTVDLVLSRTKVPCLMNIEGYIRLYSDHHPLLFTLGIDVDRKPAPRRIAKTLLQSDRLKQDIGLIYEVALHEPLAKLESIEENTIDAEIPGIESNIQSTFLAARNEITDPWTKQAKNCRRGSGPHINAELRRLLARKKTIVRPHALVPDPV